MSDQIRVRIAPLLVPVGKTYFPAPYLDLLRDMTRLPWPRVPETPVRAILKMLSERRRRQGSTAV